MSFKDEWAGDIDTGSESSLVTVVVSKAINGDDGPRIAKVLWPEDNSTTSIPIHITTDVSHPLLGTSISVVRPVCEHSAEPGCVDFIRSQLRICKDSHDNCRQDQGPSGASSLPQRLLRISLTASSDVLTVVLTAPGGVGSHKYTALSHCWASPEDAAKRVPRTTTENVVSYETTGVPNAVLSRNYRDAIDLTWKLGVEYIWIDSLCIIQDDADHKARELPKMGGIYGNAYLVIAATLARNTDYGLYHPRPPSSFSITDPAGYPLKRYWVAPDLPLLYRAWAFQERLLARRVVHFTPEELVWECRTHVDCECGELLRATIYEGVKDLKGKTVKTVFADGLLCGDADARMRLWCDIAAQYSARNITFSSDRLPALASIARQLDARGGLGRYFAGIWEHGLAAGLLWQTSFKCSLEDPPSYCRPGSRPAPTWSWLGICGWVSLRHEVSEPLVKVLDVQYVLRGPDKYGPCILGILHLAARMVDVPIIQGEGDSAGLVRQQDNGESCPFNADTKPFEYSVQDLDTCGVAAVEIACDDDFTDIIVVRLVQDKMHGYERLGIARYPKAWFIGADKHSISLG